MSAFVLDASIAAAWVFQDQNTPYAEAVLQAAINGADVIVPAIWRLELANTLVVAERRNKITPDKSNQFIQSLRSLAITVDFDGLESGFAGIMEYARQYQRSGLRRFLSGTGAPTRAAAGHERRTAPRCGRCAPDPGVSTVCGLSFFPFE